MRNLLLSILAVSFFAYSENNCEISVWGENDEIGSANLISNENTLEALKLVKKGMSYGLGIVIEPGMPSFAPRYTELQVVQPNQHFGRDTTSDFGYDITYNDDILQMWLGTGPQLDGLGHIGDDDIFYNCNKGADFSYITGLTKFGIEKIPPLVGRGVLVNMAKYFDIISMKGGQGITRKNIQEDVFFCLINSYELLSDPEVNFAYTDGNATNRITKFYYNLDSLNKLKWDIINSDRWNDKPDGKRIRNSEFLIYPGIKLKYIEFISCLRHKTIERLSDYIKGNAIKLNVNKDLFFDTI